MKLHLTHEIRKDKNQTAQFQVPSGKLKWPWKICMFPGKYHQNRRLGMAGYVSLRSVTITSSQSSQI